MYRNTHCPNGHEFTKDNTYTRLNGYRRCKACVLKSNKVNYKFRSRKGSSRKGNLHSMYNLTPNEFEIRSVQQGRKCANPNCTVMDTEDKHLHIDHDHKCCPKRRTCGKCIRGLLCSNCNLILGLAGDEESFLSGLILYLEQWRNNNG